FQLLQQSPLRARQPGAVDFADGVCDEVQRAPGGDARVELTERAGRGVSRIDEERLALVRPLLVDALKRRARQEDFAPDLENGRRVAGEGERNRPDGSDVGGDVLAPHAIAPRGSYLQLAVLVADGHGEPVQLG